MRDRPILFSAPMVRAMLAGRKTQTRRVLKLPKWAAEPPEFEHDEHGVAAICEATGCFADLPISRIGDHLYVRESYYQRGHWAPSPPRPRGSSDREKWQFIPEGEPTFDTPAEFRSARQRNDPWTVAWHKRLGRFMPRAYSRLALIINDVRVERLQDIGAVDAEAEGIYFDKIGYTAGHIGIRGCNQEWSASPIIAYANLWRNLHGQSSWDANPWVCVIAFTVHPHNIDQAPHA